MMWKWVSNTGCMRRCYHARPMLPTMQISQSAGALVLSYPLWIGAVFVFLAGLAIGYTIIARRRLRRHWPLVAAMLISAWAGVYFTTFNAIITRETGSVYGFLRYDESVR